jgi:hypothetical protein
MALVELLSSGLPRGFMWYSDYINLNPVCKLQINCVTSNVTFVSLAEVVLAISYSTTVELYLKLGSRQVHTQNSCGGRGRRGADPEAMFHLCLIF